MATLVTNHTDALLPLPSQYGGTYLTRGQSVIIADTLANVGAAFGNPPISDVELRTVLDGQQGAIAPGQTGTIARRLLGRQVISANGNYVPTPGTNRVLLRMVAAGGGGGGVANTAAAQTAVGGGGASGDYLEKYIDPGAAITGGAVTVGAAGVAGVNTGGAGGTGGDSTIVINGATLTCKGGTGGSFTPSSGAAQICAGGAGQAGISAADVPIPAEAGVPGFTQSGTIACSGEGGNSPWGSGGKPQIAQAAGQVGQGFGSGGSGAMSINAGGAAAGGAGAPGLIIVYEYT